MYRTHRRALPRTAGAVALALAAAGITRAQDPLPDPASVLTGVETTQHFEIRFRPDSRAEASVDRVLWLIEDDLARILDELGLRSFPYRIRLFLYDDVAELQRITGVSSGGHPTPLELHVPCNDDQTRVHELVHVVAERFPDHGDEPRSLLFAEGLSNAVLRFVHGVPIDGVAAFYKRRGELPSLAELHAIDDFYGWLLERPGFNGYDVAGSYMRYLLDTYGPAKVRRYYTGVPAKAAFGVDLAAIERGWHARLDAFELRPGLEALLLERAGRPSAAKRRPAKGHLDESVLGPPSQWRQLDGATIADGDPGRWDGSVLRVSGEPSQGDWSVVRLGDSLESAIVRCIAEPLEGCFGVQIQIGPHCQGLVLRGQGTFIYTDRGGVAVDRGTQLGSGPIEIVLRRSAGQATLWIDGKLIAEGPVPTEPGPLGVGSVGGPARFHAIAARPLE